MGFGVWDALVRVEGVGFRVQWLGVGVWSL
jgi:hypothetical protein